MSFSTRNALYLRISSWTVLPLYLYLDERHVHWMTDQILQAVLADLRPKLAKKFHDEQPTKKSTVEVHRGGNYQFAFFFRKTDSRHVVLLKKREYHLQAIGTPIKGSETEPATPEPPSKKRKRATESTTPARENGRASVGSSGKKTRPEREDEERPHASEEEDITTTTTNTPRRSTRAASRVQYAENEYANDELEGDEEALAEVAAEYDQTVVKDEVVEDGYVGLEVEGLESMPQDAEEEEEELDEKKDFKPVMKLSYTGFSISSRHLVLIVEPWPPLSTPDKAPIRPRSTFSRSMSRDIGIAAYDRSSTIASAVGDSRSETPLVPNSRRGGTGSVAWSATPGIGVGDTMRGATPIVANSRSGGRGAVSSTPGPSTPGFIGPPSAVRRATPLFREATPFSEAGDEPGLEDDEDDEETSWRRRARSSSWAPWRGESVDPERQDHQDDDDEDAVNMAEARGMLAMSQSLQTNTDQRAGSVFRGSGEDMDEAEDEGEEGADVDDVGGGD